VEVPGNPSVGSGKLIFFTSALYLGSYYQSDVNECIGDYASIEKIRDNFRISDNSDTIGGGLFPLTKQVLELAPGVKQFQ